MYKTTRFFIISDTHGDKLTPAQLPQECVDVAIHCGDLTQWFLLKEFRASVQLLKSINARLKLVIAGNHDVLLDTDKFERKVEELNVSRRDPLVIKDFGEPGEARALFDDARKHGIVFLNEGSYQFVLRNGAWLHVFASPYTSSGGAFSYDRHEPRKWNIHPLTNVVITHGPPEDILDRTDDREGAGCPSLFAAVARTKPLLHCFGHIHEGWGAKTVGWREEMSESPTHFSDIDNDRSFIVKQLSGIDKSNPPKSCQASFDGEDRFSRTLFVNAAVQGEPENAKQPTWVVDVDLPCP